jgi:hypothetical protein
VNAAGRSYKGWERRRENDERVTVNLPADFLPLWDRIKLNFKGTPEQRAESFLHYAHEHGSEVEWAVEEEACAKLEREIAGYQARAERLPCVEAECDSPVHGRDRCAKHYRIFMKAERLFAPRKRAA